MVRRQENAVSHELALSLFFLLLCCGPLRAQSDTPPPANLQLDGKDQGRIEISTTYGDFRHPVALQPTNATPATSVSVGLAPLQGTQQPETAITFEGSNNTALSFDSISEAQHLILRAQLPESGVYKGWIYLSYNNGTEPIRKRFELAITKTTAASTLTAEQKPAGHWSLENSTRDVTVDIDIKETGGRAANLGRMRVAKLNIVEENGAARAAEFADATVAITSATTDDRPSTNIAPNGGVSLRATIPNVREAGRYEGKIVVEAQDQQPVSADFTFLVRASWAVAAGFIGLGVLVSLLLRIWRESWQPRMVAASEAARGIAAINRFRNKLGPLDDLELRVIDDIRRHLLEYFEGIRSGIESVNETFVATTLKKQELYADWLELRRLIASLTDVPYEQRQKLEDVRKVLVDRNTTAEQIKNARSTITESREALSTSVKDEITLLREMLKGFEDELSNSTLASEWTTAVMKVLKDAEKAAQNGELQSAQSNVDDARLSAARILAMDLESRNLQAIKLNTAERASLLRLLELAEESKVSQDAIRAYDSALGLYLIGLARALRALLEQAAATVIEGLQKNPQNAALLQQALVSITTATTGLSEVRKHVQDDDLDGARSLCAAAMTALQPPTGIGLTYPDNPFADKATVAAGRSANTASTPSAEPLVNMALPIPTDKVDPEEPEAAVSAIAKLLTVGNVLYNAAVILIAVLVGLYVLWAANATWGSHTDVMLAVLWGLGLHSLGTSAGAYQGLSNLGTSIR